jgi:hypothetical protein
VVSELLREVDPATDADVAGALAEGLKKYFGADAATAILSAGDTRWDW